MSNETSMRIATDVKDELLLLSVINKAGSMSNMVKKLIEEYKKSKEEK